MHQPDVRATGARVWGATRHKMVDHQFISAVCGSVTKQPIRDHDPSRRYTGFLSSLIGTVAYSFGV